jgi:hypothetical protein
VDTIKNEILRGSGIHPLLSELEDKLFQWFRNINTRILRRAI